MAKPSLFSTAVSTATSDSHCEPRGRSHQFACDLDEFPAMSRPQCLQWWNDRVRIENDAHPIQDWRSDKLRLRDRGMSDQAIPELFHRIPSSPLPPFPSLGQGGGWSQRAEPAWASRPGAGPPLDAPPLHLGLGPGRCYNFFSFSPAVSPTDPPNPCLPPLLLWGPAHLPKGSRQFSRLRAGREAGPGAGGSGGGERESKGERN